MFVELSCEHCKKVFRRRLSIKSGTRKFCSVKCSATAVNNTRIFPSCSKCGQTFKSFNSKCKVCEPRPKRKTISKYKPGVWKTRNCSSCGDSFETLSGKYCKKCRREKMSAGARNGSSINRRSSNEVLFASLCREKFHNTLDNPKIFNGWDADVVLVDQKVAVLWNGQWHYIPNIRSNHSLIQIQNRDRFKEEQIRLCGFMPYVIKDMGKHNPRFVDQEFNKFCDWLQAREV